MSPFASPGGGQCCRKASEVPWATSVRGNSCPQSLPGQPTCCLGEVHTLNISGVQPPPSPCGATPTTHGLLCILEKPAGAGSTQTHSLVCWPPVLGLGWEWSEPSPLPLQLTGRQWLVQARTLTAAIPPPPQASPRRCPLSGCAGLRTAVGLTRPPAPSPSPCLCRCFLNTARRSEGSGKQHNYRTCQQAARQ